MDLVKWLKELPFWAKCLLAFLVVGLIVTIIVVPIVVTSNNQNSTTEEPPNNSSAISTTEDYSTPSTPGDNPISTTEDITATGTVTTTEEEPSTTAEPTTENSTEDVMTVQLIGADDNSAIIALSSKLHHNRRNAWNHSYELLFPRQFFMCRKIDVNFI